jgi:cytochrome oxidase Cu insertion factor (SCO1/SenC/PrrC family)
MSNIVREAAQMMDMLPETDQTFAYEFIKKLVKAWDPDFTKLTREEADQLEAAENSGFVDANDIDWEHLEKIL